VVLTTTSFVHLTGQMAQAFRLPNARVVVVQHPIGGIEEPEVIDRARSIVEEVLGLWTT
jgi:hypothetical protein